MKVNRNGTEFPDQHNTRRISSDDSARFVGSPLPVGNASRLPHPPTLPQGIQNPRATHADSQESADLTANLQKAVLALRNAFPVLQKILPIMDSKASNPVASYLTTAQPATPPSIPEKLENHLVELREHQRELHTQIQEQNTSIQRVEDQLEMVREATDRNTLEQQELMEDLKSVGTKVNFFAILVLLMLAGSVLLNILLYLHISRILP